MATSLIDLHNSPEKMIMPEDHDLVNTFDVDAQKLALARFKLSQIPKVS